MKKSVLSIFLIAVMLLSFASLAIADNDDSGQNSENSEQDDNENESEMESELEVEIEDSGSEIKYKEKGEIEYENGTKVKYEYEYQLRERHELSEQEKGEILRERNELKIHVQNQSECPMNCSCDGSSIKCQLQNGTEMTIRAGQSGNTIIQTKNANASTQVQLYKSEDGKVYAIFGNNETREIILPDEVQARIEMELRERVRLNNTNITLNEDGEYQIQAEKKARLFWIIPVEEKVQAQVDAETGEIIRQRNSWWGFLARDVEETEVQ